MVRAPAWLSLSIIPAWAVRDHGQAPISRRLFSSTSTIRIEGSTGRDEARCRASYRMLSSRVVSGLAVSKARARLVRVATSSQFSKRRRGETKDSGRSSRAGVIKAYRPICSVCIGPTFSL
jgi:hypothetical protein